jgi:hypothetical protein
MEIDRMKAAAIEAARKRARLTRRSRATKAKAKPAKAAA